MFKVDQSPNSEVVSVVRTSGGNVVGYAMKFEQRIMFSGPVGAPDEIRLYATRKRGSEDEIILAMAGFAVDPEEAAALDARATHTTATIKSEVL